MILENISFYLRELNRISHEMVVEQFTNVMTYFMLCDNLESELVPIHNILTNNSLCEFTGNQYQPEVTIIIFCGLCV